MVVAADGQFDNIFNTIAGLKHTLCTHNFHTELLNKHHKYTL